MTDIRTCTKVGLGFAAVAGLSASVALGEGSELPDGSVSVGLPFADTGDTSDNYDDFDAVCPYSGSTSPDVFYEVTPADGVSIALCESGYDTKTYVLDTAFGELACNDDGCTDSNGNPFRSILTCVSTGGGTIYVAVDGWSGDAGVYDLIMDDCAPPPPCVFTDECPAGAVLEGEPCDDTGAPDVTNGGCNSTPAVFSDVACGDTVCGEMWALGGTRDTDWYRLSHTWADGFGALNQSSIAEADIASGYIAGCPDGAPDCGCVAVIDPFGTGGPCTDVAITTEALPDGESWFFMGHTAFDLLPCGGEEPGNDYVTTFTCIEDPPPPPCCDLGDNDFNGFVEFADLLTVLANWGPCPF